MEGALDVKEGGSANDGGFRVVLAGRLNVEAVWVDELKEETSKRVVDDSNIINESVPV